MSLLHSFLPEEDRANFPALTGGQSKCPLCFKSDRHLEGARQTAQRRGDEGAKGPPSMVPTANCECNHAANAEGRKFHE